MMGNTTLKEIKQALNDALLRDRRSVESWLDEEFAKPANRKSRDAKVIEDLVWVRDALRTAMKKKAARSKAKRSNGKKQPAA